MPHPCEIKIPIFPLRYTVKAKMDGQSHAYQHADLEVDQPSLKHAQYCVRLPREGFVYLYDAYKKLLYVWRADNGGLFTELISQKLLPDDDEKAYKTGRCQPYISVCQESTEAYIGFSDTLWSAKTYADIVNNKNKIRDKLMIQLDPKDWVETQQAKDTLPVARIDQVAEEYKSQQWQDDFKWSAHQTKPYRPDAIELEGTLAFVNDKAQMAVVLHDNIGLTQDLGGLIQNYQAEHAGYVQENQRKKFTADLIERVYTQYYAQEENISDSTELEDHIQEAIAQRKRGHQRQVDYYQRHPGYRYMPSETRQIAIAKELQELSKSDAAFRSMVLSEGAERKSKYIKEEERQSFLAVYRQHTQQQLKKVMEAKNDRHTWLETYTKNDNPLQLGSSFLAYDITSPISAGAHAEAFASISDGMMGEVPEISGVKNQEQDLFDSWVQMPVADNPILLNLEHDERFLAYSLKNKADTVAGMAGGVDSASGILAPSFASSSITGNLVVYSLRKHPKWKGAVLNAIDNMFQEMLNLPTLQHAEKLRKIFEGNYQKLSGDYQSTLTLQKLSPRDYLRQFGSAAGLTDENVERILKHSGSLKGDQQVLNIMHTRDQGKLKYALDNPFGGKVSAGLSGLAILLFAFNLKGAIGVFNRDRNWENFFNLGSAVFGLGSGINAALMGLKPVIGAVRFEKYIGNFALTRWAAGVGAMRLFGYLGAIFEGITQGIRSYKAHSVGDTDAGNYYAVASLTLPSGSTLVITGTSAAVASVAGLNAVLLGIPVWGWIAAGVILLGIGLWSLFQAGKALDSPMDKWLDRCVFGRRLRTDSQAYLSADKEHEAFNNALYAPQILDYDWNAITWNKESASFEVYQPVKDQHYRFSIQPGDVPPKIDTRINPNRGAEWRPWNPDLMHTYVEDFEKIGEGYRYTLHVRNIPNGTDTLSGCLFYIPLINGKAGEYWVKHCFRLTRGLGVFEDIEAIQPRQG